MVPGKPLFPAGLRPRWTCSSRCGSLTRPGRRSARRANSGCSISSRRSSGAYDPDSGKRLIRSFMLISKKNSKSTIAAGIMLTALIRNWRMSAELLILAPTIEVANNSYKPTANYGSGRMRCCLTCCMCRTTFDDHAPDKTVLKLKKVVSADSDTVSGKKAAFVLIDELWVFGSKPKADAMLKEATGGLVSRPRGSWCRSPRNLTNRRPEYSRTSWITRGRSGRSEAG